MSVRELGGVIGGVSLEGKTGSDDGDASVEHGDLERVIYKESHIFSIYWHLGIFAPG